MAEVTYLDDHIVSCGNMQFYLDTPAHRALSEAEPSALLMYKHPGNLQVYDEIRSELGAVRNILELGIARGGSAAFMELFFTPERLVCVDLQPGVPPALREYLDGHSSRIRAYPGVDQADRVKLPSIIKEEFNGSLDLVIDDASHFYETTKESFELLFPRLRVGGVYVIEDWNWFHGEEAQIPMHRAWSELSLSMLAIELMVAHGSYPALISKIVFRHQTLWLQRGHMPVESDRFSLSRFLNLRGRPLPAL